MKKGHILLIGSAILVAAIFALVSTGAFQKMQGWVVGVFSPFIQVGDNLTRKVSTVQEGLLTLEQLEEENHRLKVDVRELRATNQLLRDTEEENARLRRALDYRERATFDLLPARIISREASTWWNVVTINRGFEDGVENDMPVLTEDGLVGKTTSVGKSETKVTLITDETCQVAGIVEGTPEKGIVSGVRRVVAEDDSKMQMNFLSKFANLQSGQKVVSAGVRGGLFPAGISLGKVESFHSQALDGRAMITPAVDVNALEDVFVMVATTRKKK